MENAIISSLNMVAGELGVDGELNPQLMRPYYNAQGQAVILVGNAGQEQEIIVNNATLRHEEWKDIDRTVIEVAAERLTAVADLRARGLTHNVGGLGVTISQWEKQSDMTEAELDMSGITEGEEDRVEFSGDQVPIPIVHKDFRVNQRHLLASRRFGASIDTVQAAIAGRLVAEKSEDMLFAGAPIKVESGVIYGYLNHPDRNTVVMAQSWATQPDSGVIIAEVLACLTAARADRYYGPYVIYIPGAYQSRLDEDYRDLDSRTLKQRLLALDGVSDIRISDRLTGDNVVLVQLTRDVVDLAIGSDLTTVQWPVMGGLQTRFKVMAAWAPRIKADFEGHSGIVHLRTVST